MEQLQEYLSAEPVRSVLPELDSPRRLVRRIGRVRLPVTLHHQPWATLYLLPDGRECWIVRLWGVEGVVRRCYPTATLLRYARQSGLTALEREVEGLLRLSRSAHGGPA